jgi:hypothetical protein
MRWLTCNRWLYAGTWIADAHAAQRLHQAWYKFDEVKGGVGLGHRIRFQGTSDDGIRFNDNMSKNRAEEIEWNERLKRGWSHHWDDDRQKGPPGVIGHCKYMVRAVGCRQRRAHLLQVYLAHQSGGNLGAGDGYGGRPPKKEFPLVRLPRTSSTIRSLGAIRCWAWLSRRS